VATGTVWQFNISAAVKMDKEDKNHILYAIDAFIKSVKLKNIATF
jgi:hypothetical protein